jgi:uncharacterized protein YigE (DUF2233 family)
MKKGILATAILTSLISIFTPNTSLPVSNTSLPISDKSEIRVGDFQWRNLEEGLSFARIPAMAGRDTVEIASVVKIDPKLYTFKPSFDYNSKSINEWQEQLNSPVLINASYWEPDYTPTNHLVMEGQLFIGQFPRAQESIYKKFEDKPKGTFIAGNLDDFLGDVDILGTNETPDFSNPRYETMVESWPMLIQDGKIITEQDTWIANRTIIGITEDKQVIFALTEIGDNLSLYETTNFLDRACNLTDALNMDGGIASEMAISTTNLNYTITGTYEAGHAIGKIRTKKGTQIPIPSVIGIYPITN